MKMIRSVALVLMAAFSLAACEGCSSLKDVNPHASATTPEQHAYALYGEWVIAKEAAADVVEQASTPQTVRVAVAKVDACGSPIADKLQDASSEVFKIKAQLAQGATTDDKLRVAIAGLDSWVNKLEPIVGQLSNAVAGKAVECSGS